MARNRHPRPSRDAPPSVGRAILGLAAALSLATCVRDTTGPSVTATKLDFLVPPGTLVAGHQFSPAVKWRAEYAGGNKAAGFAGAVTIELKRNPAGATLSGTTTVTAVNGVATFFDLSLDKADTGYTFQATSDGLLAIASATFDVVPGPPRQLAFTVEPPDSAAAGAAFAPAVQVSALDAAGNLVPTFADGVTVALGNNPGGGTLGGTTAVAAVNGVATFTTLTLDKTAPGYWLIATETGLSKATSSAFDVIAGTATQLVFGIEPGTTIAGHQISPAVKVRALDALGNLVPGFTSNVSIALASNPGGATLSGTTPVPAASGVATFFDLSLDRTGTGYTLTASASGLAPATSSAFDITPGAARQLAFTVQPVTSTAAVALAPAVQVSVLDASGNLVPAFTGNVGVTLGNNPGGSTLGGTTPVAAVSGVATFFDLSVNKTGTGYTLTASATGFAPVTSTAFDITSGTPTQLVFTVQPSNAVAGAPIAPAVQVSALDAAGNLVPAFAGTVTVALGNNPGGSALGGATTVATSGGVATFSTLTLDKTSNGYWLTATATGLSTAPSAAFNVTPGTATQLAFTVQPSNTMAGAVIIPAVQVSALDGAGNLVPSFTGNMTVALGNNPGGSTLGGTTTVAAVGGVATFS